MLLQLFGCYGKVNICIREGTAAVTEDADKLGALCRLTREDAVLLAKRNMAQKHPRHEQNVKNNNKPFRFRY